MKLLRLLGDEVKLRLSPTFCDKANCPLFLKLHYVDRVGEKFVRIEADRGSVVHAAVADLVRHCHEKGIQPREIEGSMISKTLQEHATPSVMSELNLMLSWLHSWAENFELSENYFGHEEMLALDEEFDECEWENGSYRGILDLIETDDERCDVTDWKSQPHILSQTDLDAHEQMTHYLWLAWKAYPHFTKFRARIWYLRYGFGMYTERSIEDLVSFEQALMIKERKILETETWDPIPGKHCQYCDYVHLCPFGESEVVEEGEIITQEQAVHAAAQITVGDEREKRLKAKHKEYVKSDDDVNVGKDWVYGYHASSSFAFDAVELEEVLDEYEISLSDYVNVDMKKLKKLLKASAYDNPSLEVALQGIKREKHSTRFIGSQIS